MQDDGMRGQQPRLAVVDEVGFVSDGTDEDAEWLEKAEVQRRVIEQAKAAAADGMEPSRAWRNSMKRTVRAQIKAKEAAEKGRALAPSARELYDRRHAVLEVSDDQAQVTFLRACTCPIGAPHTETGTGVTLAVTD